MQHADDNYRQINSDRLLALHNSTDPSFSDGMIMSGLTNNTSDDSLAAAVEYAEKIRLAGRNIDDDMKRRLVGYYNISLHNRNLLTTISATLPPSSEILFLDWLKQAETVARQSAGRDLFHGLFCRDQRQQTGSTWALPPTSLAPNRTRRIAQDEIARLSQAAASRLTKR